MSTNTLDTQKMEAFAEQIVGFLNGGALTLMISIGHRTGLFDTMAMLPPATSGQSAEAAGLNERYVREWLAAMVTGRIVQYSPDFLNGEPHGGAYHLPPEHAALLTRAASPNNMAVWAQDIGMYGAVEELVIRAFRQGGGVPYAEFYRFHDVMAEESGQTVVAALIDEILPLVPGLTGELQDGIDVLDLGCGRGRAAILMAKTFPNSRFTGYDFSADAIARARGEAAGKKLTNVSFEVKDAATLDERDRYDLICTFDAIHDQAQPDLVLENICRMLRQDGVYLMQDIAASSYLHKNLDHPMGPFLYTTSTMHCMTVSLAQGGAGLGTMWGEEKALQMLADAGFSSVEVKQLPHDPFNNFYICAKS
ncbi:MAG: class I SAM-dependent methyltransferase [Caldilineaceae bacterium]|nr:class I SAM-dependent methyltransferase [Caldilineaceae bacterium]